ncbi:hypothetical protein NKI36_08755 [Mesorhizobium caraganae]|uniref:Uncharacterized protein n=1 Tax=Mesorhizobium caraganae TaxID=483206 RepID=A0ABV1YWS7_9HYPH
MALPAKYMVHNSETGFQRLMEAPKDIPQHAHFCAKEIDLKEAHPEYGSLFGQYQERLRDAVAEAGEWWNAVVDSLVENEGGDFKKGLVAAYSGWPAGPSSNDRVVEAVREYWLKVCRVGETLKKADRVAPELFLLGWLPKKSVERTVLTGMPYWPIGLDAQGMWC